MDLSLLRDNFCAPELPYHEQYYFSLDGGGREILTSYINDNSIKLMVEVGSFLCGSASQWLGSCSELTVIGIDPWEERFHERLEKYDVTPIFESCFKEIDDRRAFIDSVKENGSYVSAMANIQKHRDRFIPLMGYSPAKLYSIKELGLEPDMVYFDSDKQLDDLEVALELFPDATLCGDDWSWSADKGYPVRILVNAFCEKHGFTVNAKSATWIIDK